MPSRRSPDTRVLWQSLSPGNSIGNLKPFGKPWVVSAAETTGGDSADPLLGHPSRTLGPRCSGKD